MEPVLVNVAGPDLDNVEKTAEKLGVKSLRVVHQLLLKWRSVLEEEELKTIKDFCGGVISPKEDDPFHTLRLSPKMDEYECIFLEKKDVFFSVDSFNAKDVYNNCVKVFNRKVLYNRSDTPWRNVIGLSRDFRPQWRALYKPPLPKRAGDIQWRLLHGVIAVNAFISVINPEISSDCPFCLQRETVFHAFMYCDRLRPLFIVVESFLRLLMKNSLCKCLYVGLYYKEKGFCVSVVKLCVGPIKNGNLCE